MLQSRNHQSKERHPGQQGFQVSLSHINRSSGGVTRIIVIFQRWHDLSWNFHILIGNTWELFKDNAGIMGVLGTPAVCHRLQASGYLQPGRHRQVRQWCGHCEEEADSGVGRSQQADWGDWDRHRGKLQVQDLDVLSWRTKNDLRIQVWGWGL